jgi:hypothetical protein
MGKSWTKDCKAQSEKKNLKLVETEDLEETTLEETTEDHPVKMGIALHPADSGIIGTTDVAAVVMTNQNFQRQ